MYLGCGSDNVGFTVDIRMLVLGSPHPRISCRPTPFEDAAQGGPQIIETDDHELLPGAQPIKEVSMVFSSENLFFRSAGIRKF